MKSLLVACEDSWSAPCMTRYLLSCWMRKKLARVARYRPTLLIIQQEKIRQARRISTHAFTRSHAPKLRVTWELKSFFDTVISSVFLICVSIVMDNKMTSGRILPDRDDPRCPKEVGCARIFGGVCVIELCVDACSNSLNLVATNGEVWWWAIIAL